MDHALLRLAHQSAVVLSISGFVVRGVASLAGAAWLRSRLARTLPHVVDTVLLASAIGLAWTLRLNPFTTPWLLGKIILLLAYIGFGVVALRPAVPKHWRAAAFVAALLCFAQIVAIAITKHAAGLLG